MLTRLLRNRTFRVVAVLVLLGASVAWLTARNASAADDAVVTRVKKGDFKIVVTTSGELRAPKFVTISGPQSMQQAEIWNGVKIQSIVAEGTQVKEGDIVAELDRSPVATKLADVTLALQKAQAQTEQASLDSVLTLSKAREDMHTAVLTLEEKKLAKDQSKFEAPSVQRQAEIDYEKAFRTLKQDSMDYVTKTEQAKAKMREVGSDLERQKNKLKVVQDVMGGFTIKAPAPGMVIYIKDWQGKKRAVGGQVSPWDPSVATLPDLSVMESVTYVNEIDVRKLAVGQPVALSLDADPGKKLVGKVAAVASVGEQRPNSDAKVFEVKITVEKPDTTLRPGMTTGNAIETTSIANVLHVPLESIMNENGVPFVFKKNGVHVTKQEVDTGAMNDDEIVITRGLAENDRVLLSPPLDKDKIALERLPNSKAQLKTPNGDTSKTGTVEVKPPAAAASRKKP
jgi:RND family efflux transporter MFP subunit